MDYDINLPWLSLDPWQKEYIETPAEQDCFLLTGRQCGKTTAMSIKAVEMCLKSFRKGENILIASLTEKQGFLMLAKALTYAQQKYPESIKKGKDKPTMHKITFTNGTNIFCYAAGETGEGLRGHTIKKLMIDEGSRMTPAFFIAAMPMLSVIKGSLDIASTPFGKQDCDGQDTFFYKCSKDEHFKKWYVSAENCPRHSKEFLERQKKSMTTLAYGQEYLALFLDDLRRYISDKLIKEICCMKRSDRRDGMVFLGMDIGGMGKDESSFEILRKITKDNIVQVENIVTTKSLTTETSRKAIELEKIYHFKKIGVDDGGIGFGVFSELMMADETRRKTIPLNNASRDLDREDNPQKKKIAKEDMYGNLLCLMEQGKIKFLDDEDLKLSLSSVQYEFAKNGDLRIYSNYGHIVEGIIRAAWLAAQDKSLNIYVY